MFWIDLALIVIAAILIIGNFLGDNTSTIVLGAIGIVFIGPSKYRPLEGGQEKEVIISHALRYAIWI
jgi:hypothetical protein